VRVGEEGEGELGMKYIILLLHGDSIVINPFKAIHVKIGRMKLISCYVIGIWMKLEL